MKSIKGRIICVILPLVVILCAILGILGCYLNYGTATSVLEQSMAEMAIVAANQVSAEVKAIQNVAVETGSVARLSSSEVTLEQKKELIAQRAAAHGFQRGNLLNTQGISLFDGNDYSQRDYFKASINGDTYISDPTISKITGKTTFLISAPLWEGGITGSKIVGVIYYAPDENFLNNIVSNINVSDSGTAILLNKVGTTVADKDPALVSVDNHINEAKTDASIAELAAVHTKMIAGESGYDTYEHEGAKWVQGYAPVANTNGWSIGVMAKESDFLGNYYLSIWATAIVIAIAILVGSVISVMFGNQIGIPIKKCVARLELLSQGDLKSAVPVVKARDETGVLAQSTAMLTQRLSTMVGEISHNLTEMSDGNFALPDLRHYLGDFEPLSQSINNIVKSLNEALSQIHIAAEQVSIGSEQVAAGAQALSQGATEQASSIEELSSSVTEIYGHVTQNADNANNANVISNGAAHVLSGGNVEMERMVVAMGEIEDSSKQIGNIIKTINDIAFQTNILALNAAVEAARAGAAGKGFAVVADEVRNLASKSANAVKDTAELISVSAGAVEKGTMLANKTAKIMLEVMVQAKRSTELVSAIAGVSAEQAKSIAQVTSGIEQISAVVQTNSATAEESAASSEQLSGQAQVLKDLVGRFQLLNEQDKAIGSTSAGARK